MLHFNEDTRVKFPATIQFLRLGYSYQSLKDAQVDFETKIFINRFKPALERINNREISNDEIFKLQYETNKKETIYNSIMVEYPFELILNIKAKILKSLILKQ